MYQELHNKISSTTSLTVLSACATRLLKLRDEILLCSSWYISSFCSIFGGWTGRVGALWRWGRATCGDLDRAMRSELPATFAFSLDSNSFSVTELAPIIANFSFSCMMKSTLRRLGP